jgi:hypothetical protein
MATQLNSRVGRMKENELAEAEYWNELAEAEYWNDLYLARIQRAVRAYEKFKGITSNDPHSGNHLLSAYLGDPYPHNGRYIIIDVTKPHIREWIDKLSGPYAETFFKMYEIQQNDDNK